MNDVAVSIESLRLELPRRTVEDTKALVIATGNNSVDDDQSFLGVQPAVVRGNSKNIVLSANVDTT